MNNIAINTGSETQVPEGLLDEFWNYEEALQSNDLDELNRLSVSSPHTIRADAHGLLVGHDSIRTFYRALGGALPREITALFIRATADDSAVVTATTMPATGGRGQQTQLWRRNAAGWAVEVTHVSVPEPAIAASTWRIVGSPLIEGSGNGPLVGATVAVKDLFSVAGYATGAGVPQFLAESTRAVENAAAVTALLAAGASVQGISHTDEFAFSLAGTNPHYGTPPNGALPGAIPGGSSSGSATAVSTGQVTIGLGTDTGGSIRVPASYQGLWGLRPTHGAVSSAGLEPLSESFDTVGWLTRESEILTTAVSVSLAGAPVVSIEPRFAIATGVADHATEEVKDAFDAVIDMLSSAGLLDDLDRVELPDLGDLYEIFRTVQAVEAWRNRGEWIDAHPNAIDPAIEERIRFGATIDATTEGYARMALGLAKERIDTVLGDRILVLPSASSVAPSTSAEEEALQELRSNTLRLTCIAGISGRPALSMPVMRVGSAPVGLCIVGPAHSDLSLIKLGQTIAAALAG